MRWKGGAGNRLPPFFSIMRNDIRNPGRQVLNHPSCTRGPEKPGVKPLPEALVTRQ